MGWHSDDKGGFKDTFGQTPITSLSLGASRKFQVKPAFDKADQYVRAIQLGHGSILHMDGYMQEHYVHQVPREHYEHQVPREVGVEETRINLTFRWHDGEPSETKAKPPPQLISAEGDHYRLVSKVNALKGINGMVKVQWHEYCHWLGVRCSNTCQRHYCRCGGPPVDLGSQIGDPN